SFLLRRIAVINSFGSPITTLAYLTNPNPSKTNSDSSSGIWPLASYLNHSCLGTAARAFIGDLLIARATRDLPPGTELTWGYLPPGADSKTESDNSRGMVFRNWGFECDCALCADAKGLGEGVVERRRALVEGVRQAVKDGVSTASRDAVLRRVESGLEALEQTYTRPAEEVPRLEAVRLMLRALKALGYVIDGGERGTVVVRKWGPVVGGEIKFWVLLCNAYQETAPELVAPAEEYARTAYRILVGEDETFGQTLGGTGAGERSSPSKLPGGSSPRRPTPRPSPPRPAAPSRWR
ncbi:hypothetical protein C8A05DRAFT_18681, partial [Staphylotrichum tortipilum]